MEAEVSASDGKFISFMSGMSNLFSHKGHFESWEYWGGYI
jgi:hypothetical protein